jgi:Tol biopolymer transport system component
MRHVFKALLVVALSSAGLGCPNRANVQCETDPNCDLTSGGICAAASNGNHWCAYPDPSCPDGYRYSGQDVGDGLAGVCVAQMPDAGIDAPPDGPPAGDKTCKLRIAFVDGQPSLSGDDGSGHRQVWVANPDGSGAINISQTAGPDSAHPSWSPDGTKLAFASNLTGKYDVFIVNVDGTGLTNLTSGPDVVFDASYPVWSPDATRIAFYSGGYVWIMNINGSGAVKASSLTAGTAYSWSPDGKKLVISSSGLYVVGVADGSQPLKINSGNTFELDASWAPGPKITFSNLSDVFMVNADATGLVNVTNDAAGNNASPVAFNNGGSIVFTSTRDNGHYEIWSMSTTGGPTTQVTTNSPQVPRNTVDIPQAVSADGMLLAFQRIVRAVNNGIEVDSYRVGVANIDGSNLHLFNAPSTSNATTNAGAPSPEARFATCPPPM